MTLDDDDDDDDVDDGDDDDDEHQTDTACSWLVCHSATVGGTVRGNTVQIVSTYPASPEARPPSFLGKPAVRFPQHGWRSAYSLRETLLDVSRESGAPAGQVEETPGRASLEKLGCRTPPQLHAGGVGR